MAQQRGSEGDEEALSEEEVRRRIRQLNMQAHVQGLLAGTGSEWTRRSEVLTWLTTKLQVLARQQSVELIRSDCRVGFVLAGGCLCLGTVVAFLVCFVPAIAA